MKIKFVFILVFYFCLKVGAQSVCDYYCGREIWSTEDNLRGEIDIQVELKKKNDNTIVLRFKKTMKPFSQMLLVETEAYFYNDKYIFNFIDGWGNKGYGYFILKDKKMIFFIDCDQFSDEGKIIGRLYGSTHLLDKCKVLDEY